MSPHARHVSSNKIKRVRFTNYQKSAPCQNLIILILSIEEAITQPKMIFFNPKGKGCCHGNQSSECKTYFKLT